VLSWNLFGLSDDDLDVRAEAAMFISLLGGTLEDVVSGRVAEGDPPEVLMFQEVVERTLYAHLRPHLGAAGYTLFPEEPPEREYFEVLAVREPLEVASHQVSPLPTFMGRELVEVVAELGGERWLLLTAHLESMKVGREERMEQARRVLDLLRRHDGPAVFGGDTNLRKKEAEELGPLPDAWEASGAPAAERWTRIKDCGQRARYDRIWGSRVRFSGFTCIGREPVTAGGDPPSDHLGVVTRVRASR